MLPKLVKLVVGIILLSFISLTSSYHHQVYHHHHQTKDKNLNIQQQHRELNIDLDNCPSSNGITVDDDDDNTLNEKHTLAAFSFGELMTSELIQKVRDKTGDFYQTVVDNLIMYSCRDETKQQRCVPIDSLDADKNWNGNCKVASDFECPAGYCERSSNCFWLSVKEGERRLKRFAESEFENSEEFLFDYRSQDSYLGGVIVYGLAGVGVGLFCFVVWAIYIMGRFCCCCLWNSCEQCSMCSPIPKRDGYNICCEIRLPIFIYIICLLAMALSGTLAYIGNEDITDSSLRTFDFSRGLVDDLKTFLLRSRAPLDNIGGIVETAAADAKTIFSDTDYVSSTATQIGHSFGSFAQIHGPGLSEAGSTMEFEKIVEDFQVKVDPIVQNIQNMLNALETDLYNQVDTIQMAVTDAVEQVDNLRAGSVKWKDEITNVQNYEIDTRMYRQGAVLVIFAISIVLGLLGLVAIVYSRSSSDSLVLYLLHLTWILCSFLGVLSFIIAGIFSLIDIVWYDSCQISDIVTTDFEPFLGDKAAAGANACFDGTNLAEAYNVTDKLDFQEKLNEGLSIIESVDIDVEFNKVLTPLIALEEDVAAITTTALFYFNAAVGFDNEHCSVGDSYSKDQIMSPWVTNTGRGLTKWAVKSTGAPTTYERKSNESASDYVSRLYTFAGKCTGPACCLNGICGLALEGTCNSGPDCLYICNGVSEAIIQSYGGYIQADDMEKNILADLGVTCPVGYTCPSKAFVDGSGSSKTLVSLVSAYKANITGTADDLIDLSTTKVGEVMDEVQDFLCNMDVSFIGDRFYQVEEQFCNSMFGGVTQITVAMWAIAILLQTMAILASILSIRMKGVSEREADEYYDGVKTLRKSDLYAA